MHLHHRQRKPAVRGWLLALALAACATIFLAPAAPARAFGIIVVNTNADTHDSLPGDGVCADAGGACSLRAAVEESNAVPGNTIVSLPDDVYILTEPLVIYDDLALAGYGKYDSIIDGNDATQLIYVRTFELLVCDAGDGSIASYRLNGAPNPDLVAAGELDAPAAIAFNPDEELLVTANSGVHHFAEDGADLGMFVDPATLTLLEVMPSDGIMIADATAGFDFYLADYFPHNRILRVAADTGTVSTFVDSGEGGLEQPNSLAFHKGDFFVTSATNGQVLRYDGATGAFEEAFVPYGLNTPRGLTFHDGALYVADEGSDSIRAYDADSGTFAGELVAPGAGGLDEPTDLAFGPDGDLYVLSSGTNDIRRYDGVTGSYLGVFVPGGTAQMGQPTCLEWRVGSGDGPAVYIGDVSLRNGLTAEVGGATAGLLIEEGAEVNLSYAGIYNNSSRVLGGGIRNEGKLIMIGSEVRGNTLIEGGGGQMSQGGGIFNTGRLRIIRSTIADNHAVRGGGISNTNQGRVEIMASTISGNIADGPGGGIRNVADGRVYISASTITNNRANEDPFQLLGEPDPYGGGIFNNEPARVEMSNTILAGNSDNRDRYHSEFSPDCYSPTRGQFISRRDNLIGVLTANCAIGDMITGDTSFMLVGTPEMPLDPRLEPLGHKGGPTVTHKLRSDSPAIDADLNAIGSSFFDCFTVDQRFSPRPQGRACDIGAFELIQGIGGAIPQPGELLDEPPDTLGEAGVKATLLSAAPRRTPISLAFASLEDNPRPVPLKHVGGRLVELNLLGADSRDVMSMSFYYPATVGADVERAAGFQLLYFTGAEWLPVRGSGGKAPALDTTDNTGRSVSGGQFTLTFDHSSTPKISELRDAVFAFAVAAP